MKCWNPDQLRLEVMAIKDTTAFEAAQSIMKELQMDADGVAKPGQAPRGKLERKIQLWVDSLQKGGETLPERRRRPADPASQRRKQVVSECRSIGELLGIAKAHDLTGALLPSHSAFSSLYQQTSKHTNQTNVEFSSSTISNSSSSNIVWDPNYKNNPINTAPNTSSSSARQRNTPLADLLTQSSVELPVPSKTKVEQRFI